MSVIQDKYTFLLITQLKLPTSILKKFTTNNFLYLFLLGVFSVKDGELAIAYNINISFKYADILLIRTAETFL